MSVVISTVAVFIVVKMKLLLLLLLLLPLLIGWKVMYSDARGQLAVGIVLVSMAMMIISSVAAIVARRGGDCCCLWRWLVVLSLLVGGQCNS